MGKVRAVLGLDQLKCSYQFPPFFRSQIIECAQAREREKLDILHILEALGVVLIGEAAEKNHLPRVWVKDRGEIDFTFFNPRVFIRFKDSY